MFYASNWNPPPGCYRISHAQFTEVAKNSVVSNSIADLWEGETQAAYSSSSKHVRAPLECAANPKCIEDVDKMPEIIDPKLRKINQVDVKPLEPGMFGEPVGPEFSPRKRGRKGEPKETVVAAKGENFPVVEEEVVDPLREEARVDLEVAIEQVQKTTTMKILRPLDKDVSV